ncbi:MAG: hypothetical protein WAO69_10915, partial [Aestuariivita sp.]|uniref:hypothetical protein n=1 Tax=Aestuariivita sp. TaxID=1872407 RepID=UPI003BB1FF32
MLTRVIVTALVGIGVTSTVASAETASSVSMDGTIHFSLGTGTFKEPANEDVDARSLRFSFEGNLNLSEKFKIGIDISHSKLNLSRAGNPDFDIDFTRISVAPTYSFGNGVHTGFYLQDASAGITGFSLNFESYGAFVGYSGNTFSVEGYAGKTSFGALGPDGVEGDDVGVIGTFRPVENLQIFAHYSREKLGVDFPDVSLSAIGAEYEFGSGWAVFGAFSSTDVANNAASVRQTSIGVSYDLAQHGMPGIVSLDWSDTDYGVIGLKQNIVSLGWTIPFGGAAAAPQTCTMNNARGKNRSAFAASLECNPGIL